MYITKTNIGYILHRNRYKEKSYLVKVLTNEDEILDFVINISNKKLYLAGLVQPFNQVKIQWKSSKSSNLHKLVAIENYDDYELLNKQLTYERFLCAYYITELTIKTKISNFEIYKKTIQVIKKQEKDEILFNLRMFELMVIQKSGYGIDISSICNKSFYTFNAINGTIKTNDKKYNSVSGQSIINLLNGQFTKNDLSTCKRFFSLILNSILENKTLNSKILMLKFLKIKNI